MGSINDFKLINHKSKRYASTLNPKRPLSDIEASRFGFYLLVIEAVSQIKDIDELLDSITDTDFCSIVFGVTNNDEGIDAVTIDNETKTINLFSFKFRESYSSVKSQSLGDIINSSKFLSCIVTAKTEELDNKTRGFAQKVLECLRSNDIWELSLYAVSNENVGLDMEVPALKVLKEQYDLRLKSITLDDIISFTSEKPSSVSSSALLDTDSILTYEEDSLSSSKSYLFKLGIPDLIRMTCCDADSREDFSMSDSKKLEEAKLDIGLLFENVRGFLGNTKYNLNILKTLNEEPSRFFMYNNGITITANSISSVVRNGGLKRLITLGGFQIVNGGQTLRSIYEFKNNNFDEEKLSAASILVRVFQTDGDLSLISNIAEYTNSQNAISATDLKSVSNLQVQIERYLKEKDIKYIRKTGDTGEDEKNGYGFRISMERMAQIIFSKIGHPDKASNQKRRLFEREYSQIFNEKTNFDDLVEYTKEYELIKKAYEESGFNVYEQKYFYVLYLNTKSSDIVGNIINIEDSLKEFRAGEDIPEARKLIQKSFKDFIDKKYK